MAVPNCPDEEPVIDPSLPIVDAHHHLWDRRASAGGLAPASAHGFERTVRYTPLYLLDEMLADCRSGHNVRATVYVQGGAMVRCDGPLPLRPVGETEFANGVAAMCASGTYGDVRVCQAIVGFADLTAGGVVEEVLAAHIGAGGGRFRGVRHSGAWSADPDVLGPLAHGRSAALFANSAFREGFARLAPLGLSFDAWLFEPQLDDLVDLACAFPDVRIVLNHAGSPLGVASYAGTRESRLPAWRKSIAALAALPNVYVKLGGLGMFFCGFDTFMAETPASSVQLAGQWRPYIEPCIEAFGAGRCMFESNFPIDRPTCSYRTLWNAFKLLAQGCSAEERTALFSGTARDFYRLPDAVGSASQTDHGTKR